MSQRAMVLPVPGLVPARRRRRGADPLKTPQLSVIIVNYCQWESTVKLVRQILQTAPARRGAVEVVVVDNHSPWHPLAARLRRWRGVSLRRWGRNRGYARAVNEGCRLSRGHWLLVLNSDLTLTEGFLAGALTIANQMSSHEERAGIVGFQLLNEDGSGQLSTGFFPTLATTLVGLMRPRGCRKYVLPRGAAQRCRVPWVSGCCLLLRRECAQELGGFDESFFLYYEDVDLCRRARAKGWSVWFEPALRAVHHHPLHRRPVPPGLRLITRHSLLTYGQYHWPDWQFALLTSIVRVEAWARRLIAYWNSDERGARLFTATGRLARELRHGNRTRALQELKNAIRDGDPRITDS
jgi:N-acetylglucosaminyl-diphospho-decaprenol L-rhamnosyltransferase